ncbi:MAG: alpha/beta hydrolase family protein [Archangium sp.]
MKRVFVVLLVSACSSMPSPDAGVDVWSNAGPYAVGVKTITVQIDGGRTLPVEVWYPAVESARGAEFAVEDFETGSRRETLSGWLAETPPLCSPRRALGARDAEALDTTVRPLIVFSHCTECFRFSMHSLAARLASHGFVFAAADHVTNTGFDSSAPLTDAFLAVRANDVSAVITAMVDELPIDSSRIAVVGHSFGAVTTARVVELDARVRSGFLIAAPADSPFLNSKSITRIQKPLSWLLAMEDNSISFIGNDFIRENFVKVPRPNWIVEVENAGHWSFSDIAGLGGSYVPGCGEGVRDPDGGAFTYVDNDQARAIAHRTVTAWAAYVLNGDESAKAALGEVQGGTRVRAR